MKRTLLKLSVFGLAGTMALIPALSTAQGYDGYREHRQQQQNQWQAIGLGSAVLGVIGLANHNDSLAIAGAVGAAYAGARYDQDRRNEYGYCGPNDRDRKIYLRARFDSYSYRDRDDRDRRYRERDRDRDRDHDGDRR